MGICDRLGRWYRDVFSVDFAKVKGYLRRRECPWIGMVLYVICGKNSGFLLADRKHLEGCYDTSVIQRKDCLCNTLVKEFDQN